MTSDASFNAPAAPRPVGPYPHARRAGNLLFLSGIGPRSPDDDSIPGTILDEAGKVIGYDFEAQCHAVFDNVRRVLTAAGATLEDLVDVTVFLTDISSDFAIMNRIYAQYLTRILRVVQPSKFDGCPHPSRSNSNASRRYIHEPSRLGP